MKLKRRVPIGCLYLMLFSGLSILMLEWLLWNVDPLGVTGYAASLHALFGRSLPAPHGLVFEPGDYQFRTFEATIGADGFRAVPESRGGDCTIAFIGDSVTFGFGSDVSFASLLAPDIPAAVLNRGIPGYNISNIVQVVEATPADGYIWLIIENDGNEGEVYWRTGGAMSHAVELYLDWRTYVPEVNEDAFHRQAAPLLARPDVLAFAFEGRGLTEMIQREFPVVRVIPFYTHTVSAADGHPNEAGNRQIAAALRDDVVTFVSRICEG